MRGPGTLLSPRWRLAAVLLLTVVSRPDVGTEEAPPPDLAAFFRPGLLWQDRNGDQVVDAVTAQIVLGEVPSPGEVSAAADVAARLGYETMALTLPLGGQAGPIIAIGARGLARAGIETPRVGAAMLRPGEGVVLTGRAQGRPALAILGGDDAGTRAAALLVAARLPHLWEPDGPTLDHVVREVSAFLADRGVAPRSVRVAAAYVSTGALRLDRLVVSVELASAAAVARAQQLLRELVAAGTPRATSQPPGPPSPGQAPPGTPASPSSAAAASEERPPLSYPGLAALALSLVAEKVPAVVVNVPSASPPPPPGPLGRRPGASAKEGLDLSSVYEIEGGLGDSDNNLIPDRIDLLLSPSGAPWEPVVDLAARLGLESTGIVLPLAQPPEALARPEAEPILVLVGTAHPLVDRLVTEGKFERPSLAPGEGLIAVVRKAFGDKSALVITGGDEAGLVRALRQVAERFPHLWERGKDRTTLDDVEDGLRRFLSGRSPAGQAATALYKLDTIAAELRGRDLEAAEVKVFVEKAAEGFEAFVGRHVSSRVSAARLGVHVEDLAVQRARPVVVDGRPVSEEFEVPSEVDEFWTLFRTRVLPAVRKRQPVFLEARLSEPPEVRQRIAREARAALIKAGADERATSVTVLSAYKQGFSWLAEVVGPEIERRAAGQPVGEILIRFAEIGPPPEWKQQAVYAPTRWLLEIFPIDEILARDLKLDLKQIRFEKTPVGSPAYEVVARTPEGRELYRGTFEPKVVVRPLFDQFPDYERVRVTTGWLTAWVGRGQKDGVGPSVRPGTSRPVVDQRIATDLERFWDVYQSRTLPALYRYVMDQAEGKPRRADAPHFGQLVVDVTLSEPDYRLGIDREQIASMESLHEELYFNTLHFFDLLGRYTRGEPLDYPGRIIPIVRPKADGRPGHARITFTGFGAPRPRVVVDFVERGGRKGRIVRDIPRVALERVSAVAARVRARREGIEQLDLRVKVDTERDERAEILKRARAERVDAQVLSAEQAVAVLRYLGELRAAGLYRDALAFHHLGTLRLLVEWEHDPAPDRRVVVSLEPNGQPPPWPDVTAYLAEFPRVASAPSGSIVQWDTPIPPPEAYAVLARLAQLPGATAYKVGESYLGREIWALDVMRPVEGSHWSHAKATTFKPTVIYSARQHANEVSSTSHTLKLAELLLTDPAYRDALDKVNVVFHPITNPDGAQLAYDLYRITPDHMLHAGYLGALGVDVTAAQWDDDPLYPESRVRPKLWRTWLPDIFLNPHGYPSHEWVQVFSEYAAWVRNRVTESRDWWGMRGWFMPGFSYLDDPRYPRHKPAAFALLTRITGAINSVPEVVALNRRAYDRYRRYGVAHDDENFKLDLVDGVLIYRAVKGARPNERDPDFMIRRPQVTVWTGGTEAPDETAYGEWLVLVAKAGLAWDRAVLDYLLEGRHELERKGESFFGGLWLSMTRPRPPTATGRETSTSGRP